MFRLSRSPLALALTSVFLLAACQTAGSPLPSDLARSGGEQAAPVSQPRSGQAAASGFELGQVKAQPIRFRREDLHPQISACDDFAGYVNSRWAEASPIPPDRTTWGSFEALGERSLEIQRRLAEAAAADPAAQGVEQLVGAFYAAGMDEAAIERAGLAPLQPILTRIAAISDRAGVTAYLREAAAGGRLAPFNFYANADLRDASRNIAYAIQGGLSLPERAYYLEQSEDFIKARAALRAHVQRLLELAGADRQAAARDAEAVLHMETRLARASTPRTELRDPLKRYVPVTLAQADALTPAFSWTALFEAVGAPPPAMFSLATPGFFREFDAMLRELPLSHWQAYLRYHELDKAAPYLGAAFARQSFVFHDQALRGQAEQAPRWKRVLDALNGSAGEAFGQLYVRAAFSPASKARMQALVAQLSQALKQRLEQLPWMGPQTRQRALEKWASFTPKIGYPERWRDWSGLHFSRDDHAGNMLAARAFNARYNYAKIGQPVNRDEWFMPPQTVNAYYNASRNEIVFPAGILQPPFFDPEADDAINYGAIVAVIGHEMIHGYDDQGSKFDARGHLHNWWSQADRAGFEARTQKLVALFDGYAAIDGIRVNGRLTLGENIADLGGLTAAYDAMKAAQGEGFVDPMIDGLSQDQRFFISWATVWRRKFTDDELRVRLRTDPHAPAMFRIQGPVSSMPAFARAFACKDGDRMVLPQARRAVIW